MDGPASQGWRPWTPDELLARLGTTSVPWCVVGGSSIDLFLGRQTRVHDDIEIAVPRSELWPSGEPSLRWCFTRS